MFTVSMKKVRKQRFYIHHKNTKMNNANEKQQQQKKKRKEKIKVELLSRAFYRINLHKRYRKQ